MFYRQSGQGWLIVAVHQDVQTRQPSMAVLIIRLCLALKVTQTHSMAFKSIIRLVFPVLVVRLSETL